MSEPTPNNIPEDIPAAIIAFAQRILDYDASLRGKDRTRHHHDYLRLLKDLENYAWDNRRRLRIPALTGKPVEDICLIIVFCNNLVQSLKEQGVLKQYGIEYNPDVGRIRGSNLVWHMDDTDYKRIQHRINEIREILQTSVLFAEKHQLSLLIDLERLQKTLHGRKKRFSLQSLFLDDE